MIAASSSWLGIAFVILLTLLYEGLSSLLVGEWPFEHEAAGGRRGRRDAGRLSAPVRSTRRRGGAAGGPARRRL